MPKVKPPTNVVHTMEEKQELPVDLLKEKPKEDGRNLQRMLKCDDISLSKLVKNSMGRVVQCAGCVVLYLIDFVINFSQSECVRNVLVVFLTVSLEAFVVMVLAICTVLTTIIVNAEDTYKSYSDGVTVVPQGKTKRP
uniref:Uncharacterized protein n=1 Tax=Photinus pyralis TaxID=7054 RepID=A0A1Y1L623_PHOPY